MLRQFFEYARYLKPVMKLFIAALAAGALAAAASGFGFPLMIAKVFPVVFDNTQIPPELQNIIAHLVAPEHMHTAVLVAVCSLLPLVFAIRGIGTFFNVYWISIVSMKVLEEIRLDAFSKLQTLPLSFIDRQKRGDLISRLINDAANVQGGLVIAANDIIKQPLTLLTALAFLVYKVFVDPNTAVVLMNLLPIADHARSLGLFVAALGLLLLFFAVWFFLRGVVGFADLIIRKGRDWCYEHGEVDA